MRRDDDPRPYRSLLYHGSLVVAGACACLRAPPFVRDGSTLAVGGATMLPGGGYRYRAVDDASFDAYGREAGAG